MASQSSTSHSSTPDVLEQPVKTGAPRKLFSIGLPRCSDPAERRFPLTPEGAGQLVEQGFQVWMERGAAATIHYSDNQYANCGVKICDRREALRADIVMNLAPMSPADIECMRRGALLLTLSSLCRLQSDTIAALLARSIITIAIDMICDDRGNLPFADILSEIDGRAAIARASSLLADSVHGKGILLGGVAGVNPAEVLILGSGMAALAAARSAIGLGGIVRLFDSDPYSLRDAISELGPAVIGSALHPRVLGRALSTADIVVATPLGSPFSIADSVIDEMKRGVVIFDLTARSGISSVFPTLKCIDLAGASSECGNSMNEGPRVCYINAAGAVPRTTAMALTNELIPLLARLLQSGTGLDNALRADGGLRAGITLFRGRVVNQKAADTFGVKFIDINLLLSFS